MIRLRIFAELGFIFPHDSYDATIDERAKGVYMIQYSIRIFAFTLLAMSLNQAVAQVDWFYSESPVLRETNSYAPAVYYDSRNNLYQMWFMSSQAGVSKFDISYAISDNGKEWLLFSNNPVLTKGAPQSFEERYVGYADVIRPDSVYKMYYTGFSTNGPQQIALATSSDGTHWTKYPGNPVLSYASVGQPKVYYDGSTYKMYYSVGLDIGMAESNDGLHWTPFPGNPVLVRGATGAWDGARLTVDALSVVDGTYFLFYGGDVTPIGLATSRDGVHWWKYPGNPVFYPPTTWAVRIEYGTVLFRDNRFHFWFAGSGDGSSWKIGYATSPYARQLFDFNKTRSLESGTNSFLESFPTPFNPSVMIRYNIPDRSHVSLAIFNSYGQQVAGLVNGEMDGGRHQVPFDGTGLESGVYFCRLQATPVSVRASGRTDGVHVEIKKLLLLR